MEPRVAVVTGGTKGTGRAIVKQFLDRGVHIVTNYRKDVENAEAFQKEFGDKNVSVMQADLGDLDQVEKLFKFVKEKYGYLDYFIANAAATAFKNLLDVKPHHIEKTFSITITAFIIGCQYSAKLMEGRRGKIVAISGYDAHILLPRHGVLGAAKSALETLVKYLSVELAPLDINVNAINPGFIDSTSTRIYMGDRYEAVKKANIELTPRARVTDGRELADVVMFLCSDEADWIVGETIRTDGGLSHVQPLVLPEV